MQNTKQLFKPLTLGSLQLGNRIAMASLTRGRATPDTLIPSELMAEYYRQRASAGLILTEGTWVNREGIGFIGAPGIFNQAQADGWKKVVEAVHTEGGKIFLQLGHAGHFSHPDHLGGALPVAASAINPNAKAFTPEGFKDTVMPREMAISDITRTIEDHAKSARFAKSAGFDGVELHAAYFYLIPSFLNSNFNKRQDAYGGSFENRARFLLEIVDALVKVWGPDKVGVKLSPGASAGEFTPGADTEEFYRFLIRKLNFQPLAYLHLAGNLNAENQPDALAKPWAAYRKDYKGILMAGGGFTKESAESALEKGEADIIAFGAPYIANPDLVERFRDGVALALPNQDTTYSNGAAGYSDYPRYKEHRHQS